MPGSSWLPCTPAGKSCYAKQVALIVFLAHIGCAALHAMVLIAPSTRQHSSVSSVQTRPYAEEECRVAEGPCPEAQLQA